MAEVELKRIPMAHRDGMTQALMVSSMSVNQGGWTTARLGPGPGLAKNSELVVVSDVVRLNRSFSSLSISMELFSGRFEELCSVFASIEKGSSDSNSCIVSKEIRPLPQTTLSLSVFCHLIYTGPCCHVGRK